MATLENQTVVVIGGSSGIGYGVAKLALLNKASHVIIASSTQSKVDEAAKDLSSFSSNGGKVTGKVLDAKDSKAIKAFFEEIGEIDHLAYTSGEELKTGFPNMDLDQYRDAFDIRFWGPMVAAQAAKIKKGGSITLTIGSVVRKPSRSWSLVAGVMGAVESATRGLAVDLAPVRVNVICPGVVKTPLWAGMSEEQREGLFAKMSESLLVKHVAEPEEIAEAYMFTMKCQYITGQRIEVDGGYPLV